MTNNFELTAILIFFGSISISPGRVPDEAGDVEAEELPLALAEQRARVELPLAGVDVRSRVRQPQGRPGHVNVDLTNVNFIKEFYFQLSLEGVDGMTVSDSPQVERWRALPARSTCRTPAPAPERSLGPRRRTSESCPCTSC